MTEAQPRTRAERKVDTLAKLQGPVVDAWVATASVPDSAAAAVDPAGPSEGGRGTSSLAEPYLVPLTLAWLRDRIVLASDGKSPTVANIAATGKARLSLGTTRDVVMIDALLEETFPVAEAPPWVADGYAANTDWDPRGAGGSYVYVILRPDRIQAWRESNEIQGRTLMRAGEWLD
jgi:hypothetical protein